jgi:hypothetical protein
MTDNIRTDDDAVTIKEEVSDQTVEDDEIQLNLELDLGPDYNILMEEHHIQEYLIKNCKHEDFLVRCKMNKILRQHSKTWFTIMNSIFISIIIFNLGAVIATNYLLSNNDSSDFFPEIYSRFLQV